MTHIAEALQNFQDDIRCERLENTRAEIKKVCAALGKALVEDPFSYFVYESERRRREVLPLFIENFVNCCLTDGHVDVLRTQDGDVIGAALWMGPETTMVSPGRFIWRMITGRTLSAAIQLGINGLTRLSAYGEEVESIHRLVPEPHYYLSVLGIVPEYQKKGLGGKLLLPTIALARERGCCLYAESTNPRNLRFYHRQGFERYHDGAPRLGPPFYSLQLNR